MRGQLCRAGIFFPMPAAIGGAGLHPAHYPRWMLVQSGKRSHFTLADLLLPVAILALLPPVLLPALAQTRGRACQAVCLADLRHAPTFCAEAAAGEALLITLQKGERP